MPAEGDFISDDCYNFAFIATNVFPADHGKKKSARTALHKLNVNLKIIMYKFGFFFVELRECPSDWSEFWGGLS